MLYDLMAPRVYVISEKMYDEYKKKQTDEAVAAVDRDIEYFEGRIKKLKEKRKELMA